LVLLIIVFGLFAGYVFRLYFASSYISTGSFGDNSLSNIDELKNLTADYSILSSEKLKVLQSFGENPVNPGVTGKADLITPK